MEKKGSVPSSLLMRQVMLYLGARLAPALVRPLSGGWNSAVVHHSTLICSDSAEFDEVEHAIPEQWLTTEVVAKMTAAQLRSLQELRGNQLPPEILYRPRGLSKPYLGDLKRLHANHAFRGALDPLMSLPSLTELTLRASRHDANLELQLSVERLPQLRVLRTDGGPAVSPRVSSFVSLRVLELYWVYGARSRKAELDAVGRALPKLDTLGLYGAIFQDSHACPLTSFTACAAGLKRLGCFGVAHVTTSAWSHFSGLETLEYQSLSNPSSISLSTPPTVSELWIVAYETNRVVPSTRARFLYVLSTAVLEAVRLDTLNVLGWERAKEVPERIADSGIAQFHRNVFNRCWRFERNRPFRLLYNDEQAYLELAYRRALALVVERLVRNGSLYADSVVVQYRELYVQRPAVGDNSNSTWRVYYSLDQGTGMTHSLVDTLEGPLSRGEIDWLSPEDRPTEIWPVRHLVWGELKFADDDDGHDRPEIVVATPEEDESTDTDNDEDTKRGDYL